MSKLLKNCPILGEMLDSGVTYTQEGREVPMHVYLPLSYAEALYNTVLQYQPSTVIEIGMAFGISSLAILTALKEIERGGKLYSIDPFQSQQWHDCGVAAIQRSKLQNWHELIQDYDYNALPNLLASGLKVNLAYIDGYHTFDHTLLDWWYVDRMLTVGGVVGFNDCGMPAVDKVISFLMGHRKYEELDVGLPYEPSVGLKKQALLRYLPTANKIKYFRRAEDRYFRKIENWEPQWDFFAPF